MISVCISSRKFGIKIEIRRGDEKEIEHRKDIIIEMLDKKSKR
jgi:hypothetical protein